MVWYFPEPKATNLRKNVFVLTPQKGRLKRQVATQYGLWYKNRVVNVELEIGWSVKIWIQSTCQTIVVCISR